MKSYSQIKFTTCTCRVCGIKQTWRSEGPNIHRITQDLLSQIDKAGWIDGPDTIGAYCSVDCADKAAENNLG